MDNYDINLLGEGINVTAWSDENGPSIIFYSEDESNKPDSIISKIRNAVMNCNSSKDRFLLTYRCKGEQYFKPPKIEEVSAKELAYILGTNFIVRDLNLVTFHNSLDDLLDEISETPKRLS